MFATISFFVEPDDFHAVPGDTREGKVLNIAEAMLRREADFPPEVTIKVINERHETVIETDVYLR